MRKTLNIISLISCWAFLLGNIYYDFADDPNLHCIDTAPDYSDWYFMPQSVMILLIIILCKHNAAGLRRRIVAQWFFFMCLALSNVLKNVVFNPLNFTVNEYIYLILSAVLTLMKYYHHKTKTNAS